MKPVTLSIVILAKPNTLEQDTGDAVDLNWVHQNAAITHKECSDNGEDTIDGHSNY